MTPAGEVCSTEVIGDALALVAGQNGDVLSSHFSSSMWWREQYPAISDGSSALQAVKNWLGPVA